MSAGPSVAAVVVTFNRKELLAESLTALLEQDCQPTRIYVIDQASTDGTSIMLEECGFLKSPAIVYTRFEDNTGGAGGFERGVRLAWNAGFEWIWIMDDDAVAAPDALSKALPYAAYPDIAAIANWKQRLDGTLEDAHVVFDRKNRRHSSGAPLLTFSSFVGLMISRRAVDRIGLPKAEFFLQGDDTEYCRRLCRAGVIVFAEESILVHKEISKPVEATRRFGRDFVVYPTDRFCFRYFMWRNRVWMETHDQGFLPGRLLWLVRKLFRVFIRTCVIDRDDLGIRLHILLRAVVDGLRGRFDNEFPFEMRNHVLRAR